MNDECERNQLRVEKYNRRAHEYSYSVKWSLKGFMRKMLGNYKRKKKNINENLKKIMSICFQLDVL